MTVYTLQREIFVPKRIYSLFGFFSRAENLEAITPPWLHFRMITPSPIDMRAGTKIAYQLRVHGFRVNWVTEIERWDPPFEFVDVQLKGPYKLWRHTHRFSEVDGGTLMSDTVEYALPFGPLGRMAHGLVARDVSRIFDYREQRVRELLGGGRPAAIRVP